MGVFDYLKKKAGKEALDINEVSKWIDHVLEQDISEEIKAFCFNLYDDGNSNWSMELVGTGTFDIEDADWACVEITDFETGTTPFAWKQAAKWDEVLEKVISVLREYPENGKYAKVLKSKSGVGVGFVDGDIEILYAKKNI